MTKSLSIIKPSIHPPIREEESPIGYLHRLVHDNSYQRISWLFTSSMSINSHSNKQLIPVLLKQPWVTLNESTALKLNELALLHENHLNPHFRYCPLCLKEDSYWRAIWHLKTSVACLKHKVWLVDECEGCQGNFKLGKVKLIQCLCSHDLRSNMNVRRCSREAIVMQLFLEGENYSQYAEVPLVNDNVSSMSLKQRSEALLFFSRTQPRPGENPKQVYKQLAFMRTTIINMQEVAVTLFGGFSGFWTFLQALNTLGYDGSKSSSYRLIKFYRLFYEKCTDAFYEPYKALLEEFINEYIPTELTQRNRLFQSKTIENHPWISLQRASRDYGISKRVIRRAIVDKLLKVKIEIKNQNKSVLLYKPDFELNMFRLSDVINATEAAAILGVTKIQFKALRNAGVFSKAIAPKYDYCSAWQFSKQEIERYARKLLNKVPVIKADYMCIPEIMKTYGKKFDDLFLMLVSSIESGELDAKTFNAKKGIRSLSIKKTEVVEWIESKVEDVDFYSVPQIAKLLVINQQFAYELIHTGVIQSDIDEGTHLHHIREEQLAAFKAHYILLSKLSKLLQLSSRSLIELFATRDIFPIDKGWSKNLRQKVYLREDVLSIHWIERALIQG